MTAPTLPPPTAVVPVRRSAGRRVAIGVVVLGLGVLSLLAFGFGSAAGLDSTFVLTPRGQDVIDISVPSRATTLALSGVLLGLGVVQLARTRSRAANVVLAVALVVFVVALLVWAARDGSTSLNGLVSGTIRRSIPIALGALAGALCERAGVINIAIEGMLLGGAFTGSIVGSAAGAGAAGNVWAGLAGGAAIGAVLGLLLAVLSIRFKVDQIIGGTVINILALGLTSFLTARVLVQYPELNRPGAFRPMSIPVLSDIPIVGPLLFSHTIYGFAMFVLVAAVWWLLFQTRWGLRLRAVGEHPRAADTVGIRVLAMRYRAVVLGGIVAGIGGTFFTLDATGGFDEDMTAGKGFIALAALIFGRWHPVGALGAALVFGFAEELQDRLALLRTPIPSQFLLMAPYVATLVVVAGLIGRARPPAADGKVYESE